MRIRKAGVTFPVPCLNVMDRFPCCLFLPHRHTEYRCSDHRLFFLVKVFWKSFSSRASYQEVFPSNAPSSVCPPLRQFYAVVIMSFLLKKRFSGLSCCRVFFSPWGKYPAATRAAGSGQSPSRGIFSPLVGSCQAPGYLGILSTLGEDPAVFKPFTSTGLE